ncbi:uncharacterized protein LOC135480941 [Liolophura sinensis]|uniref:uncharacterized protein LOC135480941 n=1 Tax=Liolophura sinensis TaxID=3198878 RepID=UPI0031580665
MWYSCEFDKDKRLTVFIVMWGGFSDVDSQGSDGWDSGGDELDHKSEASKDWLWRTSNSLQRLEQVKPSVYNITLLKDANSLKGGLGKYKSGVRQERSGQEPEDIPGHGHKTLKTNKTAWGSSSCLVDLVKQEGNIRQRPASSKLASTGRPPSGKLCRPHSAHAGGQSSQRQKPLLGMAIVGNQCHSSAQPPYLEPHRHSPSAGANSRKSLRSTSTVPAPPTRPRKDNPEDDSLLDVSSDYLSDTPELSAPVLEKLHFSLPSTDEADDYAEMSTESLLAKARNRHRGNPVELNQSAEDLGGHCCPPSPTDTEHLNSLTDGANLSYVSADKINTHVSQRICLNIDLTSVGDETDYDTETHRKNAMKNSKVDENAVYALKPSFVNLKEKPVLNLNSTLEYGEFSLRGPGGEETSSYVGFRHGRHKDDDIETMMSALSVREGQGHGQGQRDARSGVDNQSKQRNVCSAVLSEKGTVSGNRTDQSDQGAHQGSGQSSQGIVSEPCDIDGHNSSKSKYQGTVYSSLPEKNYYEMVRSESGSRLQRDRCKVPASENDKEDGSVLQQIKVVGVRTELPEKHPCDVGRSHDLRETRQIRLHSAGNNLLRRPRTSSASVNKPLRRAFPLKAGVSPPRRVTSDEFALSLEDVEGIKAPQKLQIIYVIVQKNQVHPTEVSKTTGKPQQRLVQDNTGSAATSQTTPFW